MSLPSSKYYTTKEIAAMEGITEEHLRKKVTEGNFMKPSQQGRPHRWLKSIIDKYYSDMSEVSL